jgi:hypothetical protein
MFRLLSALLLSASLASASTVTFSCVSDGGDPPGVILKYTVTAGPNETIKDVHLGTLDGKKAAGTPHDHDNDTPGNTTDDWVVSSSNGMHHWRSRGGAIRAGGSLTFRVTLPQTTCADVTADARWITTSNGELTYTENEVVDRGQGNAGNPIKIATVSSGLSVTAMTTARIGQATPIVVQAPQHAGQVYTVALSFGSVPGIPLSQQPALTLPLNPDPLFWLTVQPNPILQNNVGLLPLTGRAQVILLLPPVPQLFGVPFFAGGTLVSPAQPVPFTAVSDAEPMRVSN